LAPRDLWAVRREAALRRLEEHLRLGLVDADIADLLVRINRLPCIFTTSSCSGRIVLLEAVDLMEKRGARKLWVTHDPSLCLDVCNLIGEITESRENRKLGRELLWISLQPPVLHFYAQDEVVAMRVVDCARRSGFVRACYRREDSWYFVEVSAHDKLHVILPAPCTVISTLCKVLSRYKERLRKFEDCILKMSC
jgi:tRNA wybutosine-synthesizing protein 3